MCEATGAFWLPDAVTAHNGVNSRIWQIQTNATYDGGIDVPHMYLSDAKISIISETAKHFSIFFQMAQKQRDAGPENLRPIRIELLQ